MSQSNCKEISDDEYEDALGHPIMQKSEEGGIEEIIQKHDQLKLTEESADDYVNKALSDGNDEEGEGATAYEEAVETQHDDTDDEQALIEMEKVLTDEELKLRKEHAEKLKLMGNEQFREGKIDAAIETYSTALQICPIRHTKERAILHCNRAAASIQKDEKEDAIKDCTKAIALWPEYVRALLRRAKLYNTTDKLDEALKDYEMVYKLDPGNQEAREALVRLPPLIEERNERMKAEVMDKLKDLGNLVLKPFGLSTSNFQMQKDPATGSYSINFNQNKS